MIARIRQAPRIALRMRSLASSRPRPGPSLSLSSRVRHRILPGDRWPRPRPTRRPSPTSFRRCSRALSEFETYRGVVKDAQDLLKKQEQTMKQAAEAATKPDSMGKSADALSPEQKAELGNLAARQSRSCQGFAEPAGAHGRDRQAARRVRPAGRLRHARGGGEQPQAGHQRQDGRGRRAAREKPDGPGPGPAGQGPPGTAGPCRRHPEPPRTRAFAPGQGAEERRVRAARDLRKRQAQNLKTTRDAKQNPNAKNGATSSRGWPRSRPRSSRTSSGSCSGWPS